jgi:hypothetical protein
MRPLKRVLRPDRLRRVPAQFSWVDQALVQRGLIDRCEASSAALYLFLVTVADARGLSYWGSAALVRRLHMDEPGLAAARAQLIALDLIAYEPPLYQVLALSSAAPAREAAPSLSSRSPSSSPATPRSTTALSLADLLGQLERRRDRL